jgi:hypothetical protein
MLVHVILEDLGPLTETAACIHSVAFADLDTAREYITECAEETISEAENPALVLRHADRKVEIFHNGQWVGVFEINTVEVK